MSAGWRRWIMLRSDAHHDNLHCRQDIERRQLEKAIERDALIIDVGDIFCAMQGRGDPRGNYDALRPEHRTDKYLDALVSTASKFYQPYARHFALIAHGNHETAVIKHRNTDLIDRLTAELRRAGGVTMPGTYAGWITLRFDIRRTVRTSKTIRYFHGSGGGGPVTRGVIQSNRMAVNWPDGDVVVSGHTRDAWVVPVGRDRVNTQGLPYQDYAWHVRTPTYKDETSGGMGWAIEKALNPKPLGCAWLELTYSGDSVQINASLDLEAGGGVRQRSEREGRDGVPAWELLAMGAGGEGGEGDA